MVIAAAVLFGLALGALAQFASIPRHQVVPQISITVIVMLAVAVLFVHYPEAFAAGIVMAFATAAGTTLAAGFAWKEHPLLAGVDYWSRVWFALRHDRVLRAHAAEAARG